jgi:hypothetical protein
MNSGKNSWEGHSYLHVFPIKKQKILTDEHSPLYLGLNLDGKYLGVT